MTEMIERVAEALKKHMFAPHELPLDERLTERYAELAKVAIQAMREPTESMAEYGVECLFEISQRNGPNEAATMWRSMVDVATDSHG